MLVADLGATSIDVAVTDLDGRTWAIDEPADIAAGPEACLQRVDELFAELTTATRNLPGRLWGIGIGIPGRSSSAAAGRSRRRSCRAGTTTRFASGSWRDTRPRLGRQRCERPGARRVARGIAVGHDNVIVVKIGTGIGAGIISNGRIHRGAQGSAGDVGHIQVVDDTSIICRCGNVGCLEALAGGAAIGRDGEAAARGTERPACRSPRPARSRHRRRREGCVVRRSGVRRPAPVGRASRRADARERGEPVQSVARSSSAAASLRAATSCWRPSARPSTDARCRSPRAS